MRRDPRCEGRCPSVVSSFLPFFGEIEKRVDRPRRWDMRFIGRFMVEFGILSSLFDLLTFIDLLAVFSASTAAFRTA